MHTAIIPVSDEPYRERLQRLAAHYITWCNAFCIEKPAARFMPRLLAGFFQQHSRLLYSSGRFPGRLFGFVYRYY